jgi:hypothetical protein
MLVLHGSSAHAGAQWLPPPPSEKDKANQILQPSPKLSRWLQQSSRHQAAILVSGMDSVLEAFMLTNPTGEPTGGSFSPLAAQLNENANYLNQLFLSHLGYEYDSLASPCRVKLTCFTV